MGIGEGDASFLLSVIGIANTLGRIVLGYISDRPWLNRLYTYNLSLAVCGICESLRIDFQAPQDRLANTPHVICVLALGMSNFCFDYTSQAMYCAVFGICSGAYVGLTSVVLVDLLGLDRLTNAFGLLLLFQGIASVLGPPIIGKLQVHELNTDKLYTSNRLALRCHRDLRQRVLFRRDDDLRVRGDAVCPALVRSQAKGAGAPASAGQQKRT